MTALQGKTGVPGDKSECRQRGITLDHGTVARASDAVEDNPPDIEIPVKCTKTGNHGMRAPGHPPDIDHKDCRCLEDAHHMRRACGIAAVKPVVHSHHSFDNGDVSAFRGLQECSFHSFLSHHERVKVSGDTAGNGGMVGWIDEVRPYLERLDTISFIPERPHQAPGDGCLSAPAVGPCDNDPGDVVHAHSCQLLL